MDVLKKMSNCRCVHALQIYVYIYIYIYMFVCVCIYIIYTHTHTHICIIKSTTFVYVCMHASVICLHIHICMHTYIHTERLCCYYCSKLLSITPLYERKKLKVTIIIHSRIQI